MEIKNVYHAYSQLETIRGQMRMLKTQEDSLKAYLKDQLESGPKDGVFMQKTMRKSVKWKEVSEAVRDVLSDEQSQVYYTALEDFTTVSEVVSFKEEKDAD